MKDDEYELMPRTELEYLRKEVEKLKRNPLGDTQSSISLLDSINKLDSSVNKLNAIFESANDDMIKAFNEKAMQDQLVKILDQQEKLAKGIVAVAELVKDMQEQQKNKMPEIEQIINQSRAAQEQIIPSTRINTQSLSADPQPQPTTKIRNPFEEEKPGGDFRPLINEPLPRPGLQPPQATPQTPPPPVQAAHDIPDGDIPPPPRRY